MNIEKKISLFKQIQNPFRSWWWIALLMALGGLIGFTISFFTPPQYDSRATITVSVDYTRTGEFTDVQDDEVMRGVGALINSDEVIQKTLTSAKNSGINYSMQEFRDNAFLDRADFRWVLRFRSTNANVSRSIVNFWAHEADQYLQDSQAHAIKMDILLNYLDSLEKCMQRSTAENISGSLCAFPNLPNLLNEIQTTGVVINEEKQASHGLISSATCQLTELGQIIDQPVIFNRNLLSLAGAFIGLIAALLILMIWRH